MANINFYNVDNIDFMRDIPDKFYDLAIADPPYFSGPEKRQFYGQKVSNKGVKRVDYPVIEQWELPTPEYFKQFFRISKNQIIWGCNYYDWKFNSGRIIWDKVNGDSSFSDCEIAFCSMHDTVRLFRYMWNGMLQGKSISEGHVMQGNKKLNEKKIYKTQKPVNLYIWILQKYAKPNDNIFDSHGGSMSIAIACELEGFDLDICEINKTHFNRGVKRFNEFKAQKRIDFSEIISPTQPMLF